jgi:hypothetical protein
VLFILEKERVFEYLLDIAFLARFVEVVHVQLANEG